MAPAVDVDAFNGFDFVRPNRPLDRYHPAVLSASCPSQAKPAITSAGRKRSLSELGQQENVPVVATPSPASNQCEEVQLTKLYQTELKLKPMNYTGVTNKPGQKGAVVHHGSFELPAEGPRTFLQIKLHNSRSDYGRDPRSASLKTVESFDPKEPADEPDSDDDSQQSFDLHSDSSEEHEAGGVRRSLSWADFYAPSVQQRIHDYERQFEGPRRDRRRSSSCNDLDALAAEKERQIMQRRARWISSDRTSDKHFINAELAARSQLFNSSLSELNQF